jgi:hypothetical protein
MRMMINALKILAGQFEDLEVGRNVLLDLTDVGY